METLEADFTENHILVKTKFEPRGKHFYHWVIEANLDTRKKLPSSERIHREA